MAMGLIAAALGGVGKALASAGEMEAKKQNEASLRKELMAAETEERLRVDEITNSRKLQRMVPEAKAQAEANVAGQVAGITASTNSNLPKLQANQKLENLRAEEESGISKLEAKINAGKEKDKFQAMIDAGVPKAKADVLFAEYKAADPQRKAEAQQKIDDEIGGVKAKAKDKGFLASTAQIKVAENAGQIAEVNARNNNYNKEKDKVTNQTTKDLERKFGAATDRLAYDLGVAKNKVNEELNSLKKRADRGDANASSRLKSLKDSIGDWESTNADLRNWSRDTAASDAKPAATPPSEAPSKTSRKPLSSFNN